MKLTLKKIDYSQNLSGNELLLVSNFLDDIASKSPDPRTKVGCFVSDENGNIKLSACNELPKKIKLAAERLQRPEKYNWIICAERNLTYIAAKQGIVLEGLSLFSNRMPCIECAKSIIQSGIKIVNLVGFIQPQIDEYKDNYNFVSQLFKEALIPLKIYDLQE